MTKFTIPIGNHFMWIFLHKDKEDFIKAIGHDDCNAVCMTKLDIEKDDFYLPKWMGMIHFIREHMGSGMVSHEILHAILHYARYSEEKLTDEDLCKAMQKAVSGFWTKYFKNIEDRYNIQIVKES